MKGISEFFISKGLAGATATSGQGDSSDEVRLLKDYHELQWNIKWRKCLQTNPVNLNSHIYHILSQF